jgi:uncharacterized protein YqeY
MLKDELLEALKDAMKNKNENKKNAIQMARASVLQEEKDKKITLNDEQVLEVISKEVKKRKESIPEYEKAQREDIINKIKEEISYLEVYLPKQLTDEELEEKIKAIVEKVGATSIKDMGNVMKEAKIEIGASADGKRISDCVRKILG